MDNLKEEISNVDFNSETTDKNAENVENAPFFEKTNETVDDFISSCDDFSTTFQQPFSLPTTENAESSLDDGINNGIDNGVDDDSTAYTASDNACLYVEEDKCDREGIEEDNTVNNKQDLLKNLDENHPSFSNNPNAAKTRYVERNKRSTNALILSLVGLLLSVVVFIGIIPSIMGFAKSLKLYKMEKTQTEKWGVWVGFVAILANVFMIVAFILFLAL